MAESNGRVMTTTNALAGFTFLLMSTGLLFASDARYIASLKRLDPNTRLEQVCDAEAMMRIARDMPQFVPDRAKSDIISHPHHSKNVLSASGAAFRSKGHWYRLSFVCKGSADLTKVLSFTYQVGKLIPQSQWNAYGLWP